jgi:hypothetical protein
VAEGLRLGFSDTRVETQDLQLTENVRSVFDSSLGAMTAIVFPPFIVAHDGTFLHLEDPAQVQADLKAMAAMAAENDTLKVALANGIVGGAANDPVKGAQAVANGIAVEWNLIVGAWRRVTLKTGAEMMVQIGPAETDARTLTFAGAARFVGRVACDEDDQDRRCVALETVLRADPVRLLAMAQETWATQHLDQSNPLLAKQKLDAATKEFTVRLVTEPDTLLPRHAQTIGRTSLRLLVADSVPIEVRDQTEQIIDYAYLSP